MAPVNHSQGENVGESSPSRASIRIRVKVADACRNRVRYALRALLEPVAIEPEWVEESEGENANLYYGPPEDRLEGELQLAYDVSAPGALLGVELPEPQGLPTRRWEGEAWPVLFSDVNGNPDVVAGACFLLTGVQETIAGPRDQHGRFRAEDSVQGRGGFADLPVVDAYRAWLVESLRRAGFSPRLRHWGAGSWALCPTFDVDYLRKWRPGMVYRETVRNLMLDDRGEELPDRIARFREFVSDVLSPGDAYRSALTRMIDEVRARHATATVFLKAGAHGPFDVKYSLGGKWIRRVVGEAVEHGFEIGLHPSYHASTHGRYLAEEIEELRELAGRRPTTVRQHYLRYEIPTTLRLHEVSGFTIDSTLGFSTQEGFRRGTCLPFRLFDSENDRETGVWEMPLAAMDGALFNRRDYSVSEAVGATRRLLDRCRLFGGCAVVLWHNVLWDEMDAPGWGRHFLEILDYASSNGALMASLGSALALWRGDSKS